MFVVNSKYHSGRLVWGDVGSSIPYYSIYFNFEKNDEKSYESFLHKFE